VIGLDTNVLVRHITQDDPVQSPVATDVIERRLTEQVPGFISLTAMTETAWVLARSYGLSGPELSTVVEQLLQNSVLVVERAQQVYAAMIAEREGRGRFADTLIAELGAQAGCEYTLTFDRRALRLPGFALP
jgi:predicted nucleic-acid-binding protein